MIIYNLTYLNSPKASNTIISTYILPYYNTTIYIIKQGTTITTLDKNRITEY